MALDQNLHSQNPSQLNSNLIPRFRVHQLLCGWFLLVQAVSVCGQVRADEQSRPNIIIMMADDMGYSDLGCYGGEIETPHLDALAAEGVRFTQFYNTARCCPTRAALLSGVYPHQAGMGHMTELWGLPGYQGFLNRKVVTIAEALKPAGYRTMTVGKWHVGAARGQWPLDRGFDRYFGTPSGGGFYFKEALDFRKLFVVLDDQEIPFPDEAYVTDLFTDYALQFVEEATEKEQPFFLYFAHIAPHWPLQAKPEDIARYEEIYQVGWDEIREARYAKQLELGIVKPEWKLSPRHPQAKPWNNLSKEQQQDLTHRMAVYAAQIDCIDQNVGRLVNRLKQLGVYENTVILFLSDNGCSAEGGPGGFRRGDVTQPIGTPTTYASVGLEWANVSDTPYRWFKMNTHEGGVATPLIVHWPQGISRRGELEHQFGHVIDLMPTCLELAHAIHPESFQGEKMIPLEGTSLVPAFQGKELNRDQPLFWEHEGNRAIRQGKWKLVAPRNKPWELYDLATDRTELNNLAKSHPAKVRELSQLWQSWADRCHVLPWPIQRKN